MCANVHPECCPISEVAIRSHFLLGLIPSSSLNCLTLGCFLILTFSSASSLTPLLCLVNLNGPEPLIFITTVLFTSSPLHSLLLKFTSLHVFSKVLAKVRQAIHLHWSVVNISAKASECLVLSFHSFYS